MLRCVWGWWWNFRSKSPAIKKNSLKLFRCMRRNGLSDSKRSGAGNRWRVDVYVAHKATQRHGVAFSLPIRKAASERSEQLTNPLPSNPLQRIPFLVVSWWCSVSVGGCLFECACVCECVSMCVCLCLCVMCVWQCDGVCVLVCVSVCVGVCVGLRVSMCVCLLSVVG